MILLQAIREPREREQLFNEHMKERERKDREHRRAELKKKKSAFKALLEANKGVRVILRSIASLLKLYRFIPCATQSGFY